jgi:hypothetical protein
VSTKKKPAKTKVKARPSPAKKAAKPPRKSVSVAPKKAKGKAVNAKAAQKKTTPAPKSRRHEAERPNHKAPPPQQKKPKTTTVTAKIVKPAKPAPKPELSKSPAAAAEPQKSANALHAAASAAKSGKTVNKPAEIDSSPVTPAAAAKSTGTAAPKSKSPRTTLDDLPLDIDEKDELLEEEKRDLIKALRDDEDEPLETAFVPTDTSERFILVVDEEGQRRNETVTIVSQILPNAVVEVADDPEEAHEIMQDCDFDTYVVNFLMPGFSASPFVKAVANHPDHPLLIGFAADKISDALDQRKGLKIIPLKRLFDLDVNTEAAKDKSGGAED